MLVGVHGEEMLLMVMKKKSRCKPYTREMKVKKEIEQNDDIKLGNKKKKGDVVMKWKGNKKRSK